MLVSVGVRHVHNRILQKWASRWRQSRRIGAVAEPLGARHIVQVDTCMGKVLVPADTTEIPQHCKVKRDAASDRVIVANRRKTANSVIVFTDAR